MYSYTTKDGKKTKFATTLNKKLLIEVKEIALRKEMPVNEVIEEALKNYYKL